VVLTELAQADSETAVDSVALALGIDARLGVPATHRVVELLASTDALLLIDNCEHVLDTVAEFVETVVRSCPNVTVLATSRERLRVQGEHVCAVSTC
jgi:predicted ATPase